VETWANVPKIIENGAKWYANIGTETSKGTKIFSLVGKVKNTGLVEVPMGITLEEIIYDIGYGTPNGKKIKAIQTGGPSGGCIPRDLFNLPIDYESLKQAGSIMGSGGMIVMDEDTCMVDFARYFINFLQAESCGKCSSCREGTQRMFEILTDITEGKANEGSLELLEELAYVIKETSLCGLGQTAPNPVLSTLKYFKNEYISHIKDKKCSAGVCRALILYRVDPEKCTGCGVCKIKCPEGAIDGELKQPHLINQDKCIRCGFCQDSCNFDSIICDI
jgi:NADH:ubiquinone oxidoreductase subunit F (NADH-binding)